MTDSPLLRFQTRPDRPEEPGTEILIGVGAREVLSKELERAFPEAPYALLVDEQVLTAWRTYVDRIDFSPITMLALPAGEEAKTTESWVYTQRALVRAGLPRRGFLVGIGGGATGDLCAFTASSYHRGIGVALLPTSLLAMVDASLGGKCGINLPEGKNLVGAFHDARLIIVDPGFLSTLPLEEFKSGLGEVLKYAFGFSEDLFELLEKHSDLHPGSDPELLASVVGRCLKIKASIVESDPNETKGLRILLNLGHTTAHALETWASQQDMLLPHGIAVSLGLRVSLDEAQRRKLLADKERERCLLLLERFHMPVTVAAALPDLPTPSQEELALLISRDKKRGAEEVRVVLPTGRGQCEAKSSTPMDFAQRVLQTVFMALAMLLVSPAVLALQAGQVGQANEIQNPYFEKTSWKVWRDDASPVPKVLSMARQGKQNKAVQIDLLAIPKDKRLYPVLPKAQGEPLLMYRSSSTPSEKFAGIWDDVYSSWSGLHGYVRNSWRGVDGSKVAIRNRIVHFVDTRKREMMRCGVNFIHQSTTGMAHTITNGYSLPITRNLERLYFADLLVCSPAHNSFTDQLAEQSRDLYTSHVPTIFNSVGSSNSETMAITKMILAGGYLPPKTKLLLKRSGLYPAAMLYLWKAGLPYEVSYDHELRHRIAYKSVGDRKSYPEKYSSAGIDKGDLCLAFHQYDDLAHMRNMVRIAQSMDVALPEACFEILEVEGGRQRYALHKAATVVQTSGEEVKIRISTQKSYDLQGLPVTLRWKLLYGNKRLRLEPTGKPGEFGLTVPWDPNLPEGRTVLALIANNGRFDSNPALLTIYRKIGEIPPNGGSPQNYKFDIGPGNRRPILLGLQDRFVKPGRTLEIPLKAHDPEGFPVTWHKREGDIGRIEGATWSWKCPRHESADARTVTFLASDGTSGNSYSGKQIRIHIGKPDLLAQIHCDKLVGMAPLVVKLDASKSVAPRSKTQYGWDVYKPALKRKPTPDAKTRKGKAIEHRFDKPGLYEVRLTVSNGKRKDVGTMHILVTKSAPPDRKASMEVEGNGVWIANGDSRPSLFDHTDFGTLDKDKSLTRTFHLVNTGDRELRLAKKDRITIEGENAKSFKLVSRPDSRIAGRSRSTFAIRFRPKTQASELAWVSIRSDSGTVRFRIQASR